MASTTVHSTRPILSIGSGVNRGSSATAIKRVSLYYIVLIRVIAAPRHNSPANNNGPDADIVHAVRITIIIIITVRAGGRAGQPRIHRAASATWSTVTTVLELLERCRMQDYNNNNDDDCSTEQYSVVF